MTTITIKRRINKRTLVLQLILFLFWPSFIFSQGRNHVWLLGYNTVLDASTTSTKARLNFDSSNVTLIPEARKLPFRAAQANISDENGNLLMATNGCWIADASGDTMQNSTGLNPGPFTDDWCDNHLGIPFSHTNVFLPMPSDSMKYVLFHQTGNYNLNYLSSELYFSVVDLNLNGGFGGVDSNQKNVVIIQDTLGLGIAACKHANGRDWWVVILKDSMQSIYKLLLTPNGIISVQFQSFANMQPYSGFNGQPIFSQGGTKFAFTSSYGDSLGNWYHDIRLFDFDRCTGVFSNPNIINVTDSLPGLSTAFSPNSKYIYTSSSQRIFQIDINSLTIDTVALNDGFAAPNPPLYTDFWLMYLAANGKIYISSGNSVTAMHYINSPDSGGLSCDVQQHALSFPCYVVRADVNHPNYYLGPVVGSACDTLGIGIEEYIHDFHFAVSPNPSVGNIKIIYLLPQNKGGLFEIYDINGRKVFTCNLSPWSTLQNFNLLNLKNGVYVCTITSDGYRVSRKIVVVK